MGSPWKPKLSRSATRLAHLLRLKVRVRARVRVKG